MSRVRSLIALLVIFSQFQVFGAPTPLGIIRSGELTVDSEKVFPLVEKRLQRFIEKVTPSETEVKTTGLALSTEAIRFENEASHLTRLIDKVLVSIEDAAAAPLAEVSVLELSRLRTRIARFEAMGPLTQKALLVEAFYRHRSGKPYESLIREALLLHPDLTTDLSALSQAATWELTATNFPEFEKEVKKISDPIKRSCLVDIKTTPATAKISANGFSFPERKSFRIAKGRSYLFQAAAKGYAPKGIPIRCDKPGAKRVVFELAPSPMLASEDTLTGVVRIGDFQSLYLIQTDKEVFRFYLFTEGVGLDEIPLREPLKVADVMGNPGNENLPIATDAFLNLFQKHQRGERLAQDSVLDQESARVMQGQIKESPQWYNDWRVWAIAGGVTALVAISFFATRESPVRTQGGISIAIH